MYDNEPTMMGQAQAGATLVVRQGPQAGMSFPLTGNQVIIGREEGMGIVLQDPESSRRHSRVSWQGNQYTVEDLGSTNGTFVNGVQITAPKVLSPGDSIGIGQTALVFQMAGAPMEMGQGVQTPVYTPTSNMGATSQGNKSVHYMLYGCGCLLFLCICSLLVISAWAVIDPQSFMDITGLDILGL